MVAEEGEDVQIALLALGGYLALTAALLVGLLSLANLRQRHKKG